MYHPTIGRKVCNGVSIRQVWWWTPTSCKSTSYARVTLLQRCHAESMVWAKRNKNRLKIRESQQGKCIKIKRPAHLSVPILTLIAIFSFAVSIWYSIVQYFHPTWLPIPLLLASFPLTFLDRISPSHILRLQLAGYLIPKHIGLECGLFPCR